MVTEALSTGTRALAVAPTIAMSMPLAVRRAERVTARPCYLIALPASPAPHGHAASPRSLRLRPHMATAQRRPKPAPPTKRRPGWALPGLEPPSLRAAAPRLRTSARPPGRRLHIGDAARAASPSPARAPLPPRASAPVACCRIGREVSHTHRHVDAAGRPTVPLRATPAWASPCTGLLPADRATPSHPLMGSAQVCRATGPHQRVRSAAASLHGGKGKPKHPVASLHGPNKKRGPRKKKREGGPTEKKGERKKSRKS